MYMRVLNLVESLSVAVNKDKVVVCKLSNKEPEHNMFLVELYLFNNTTVVLPITENIIA